METIIYQGQPIQATLVNYLSGSIPTSTVDADGDEELFRDEAGRYYLRRKLNLLADYHEDYGCGNIAASGRTHVHRVSTTAAVLWATTRLNSDTLDLRCDAARLLTSPKVQPGNVQMDAEVPAGFEAEAKRLGFAAREYLWHLAEDALAQPPHEVRIVRVEPPSPAALEVPPVQVTADCHRFVFDYPATRNICGRQRTIELTDAEMARATELAAAFDLSPTQFVHGLADHNALPGQLGTAGTKLESLLQAEHLAFVCMDKILAKRIERAAQARNQTADEFVAYAVGTDVDMWEEAMLVHPVTGELLAADYEELFTEDDRAYKVTAPPIGRENDPRFLAEQQAQALPDGMTVRLEAEATALVRRYLGVTPFDYAAADIVSGCVRLALEEAFDNLEEARAFGRVDSAEFHDGAWGYVEAAIYQAQNQQADARAACHAQEEAA